MLIMLWIFVAACPVYCSIFFVAPNGNNSNPGTIDSPFATIPYAVNAVAAGDTIYVRGGTHTYTTTITISKSGTNAANYYLLAYDNERPVLDFSSMSEDGSNRGIRLSGSYWYIKGIDIYKAGDNGINISGSYNIIEFCRFYENRDSGLQIGGGGAYNEIINCDSYYNCDSDNGDADGFAPKLDVGTGNYFYGCRAWNNSDDDYDGYLRGADDITTTYENCWAMKAGYLKNGTTGSGNGNGFKMGGSDDKTLKHNVILNNCLAFQNWKKGFDQNSDLGSMTLNNCTAFNNGTYNYSITLSPASGKAAALTNCSYLTGSNNLGSFVVQTTNSWSGSFTVTSADFVSIDPSEAYGERKANGDLPDITFMYLAADSDLIDGGTNVGLPYNGIAPDLGCFEYSQSGIDYPPAAPTDLSATGNIGSVVLNWNDNSESDLDGYNIYRSTTSGSEYSRLNSSLLGNSNYTDDSVADNITYYYVITAVDFNENESGYSNEAAAIPTIYGDFIVNGIVDIDDLAYLCNLWLINDCQAVAEADLDDDCLVNFYEFSVFANNWLIIPPDISITIQENTDGFCSVDGSIDNNNSGYTGTGFANTNNSSGNGIDWSINVLSAGTYTFKWRYANSSGDRTGNLLINDSTAVSNISFPSTGSWTIWTTVSTNVNLTTGIKNIRLEATTSSGLANIDYIEITGLNLTTATCQ